jgi:hypothetical protein
MSDEQLTAMKVDCSFLGEPQLKSDGTMTFEYFLDSQKIILRYVHQHTKEELQKRSDARREIMKNESQSDGYETKFAKAVTECSNFEAGCLQVACAHFYQHVKIDKAVYDKSSNLYMMDPEKRTKYEEEAALIKESGREEIFTELDKETLIKGLSKLEEAKFDA